MPPQSSPQVFTVEYVVTDELDGVTEAPAFEVDPQDPDYEVPAPDGIYRREVDRLGLIDPDLGEGNTRGNRLVAWAWVRGPIAADASAAIEVIDDRNGLPPAV